jgi:hypothetical protein
MLQQSEVEVSKGERIVTIAVVELVHLLSVDLWPQIFADKLDLLLGLHRLAIAIIQQLLDHALSEYFDVATSQLPTELTARQLLLNQRFGLILEQVVQV